MTGAEVEPGGCWPRNGRRQKPGKGERENRAPRSGSQGKRAQGQIEMNGIGWAWIPSHQ